MEPDSVDKMSDFKEVLQEVRDDVREIRRDVVNCRVEIASLKTKSKVWGGMIGLLTGGSGAGMLKLLSVWFDKSG